LEEVSFKDVRKFRPEEKKWTKLVIKIQRFFEKMVNLKCSLTFREYARATEEHAHTNETAIETEEALILVI